MLSEAQVKFIPEGTASGTLGYVNNNTHGVVLNATYDVLVQGMTLLNSSGSVIIYLYIHDGSGTSNATFTLLDACNHSNGSARFTLFPNPIRIKKGYTLYASTATGYETPTALNMTSTASGKLGVNVNYMIDKPYNNTN